MAIVRTREHREAMVARSRVLGGSLGAALLFVFGTYWLVQGVQGSTFRMLAENNRLREEPIEALRGLILDRSGHAMVENVPSYTLRLDPELARDPDASLAFAASILDIEAAVLGERLRAARQKDPVHPSRLAEQLSLAEVARFELATYEHPEFEIEVEQQRLYRHREQTAHVLGYLGEANPEDLAGGRYRIGERVGRRGIESTYQEVLRGIGGERVVVVDSRGRPVEAFERESTVAGRDLRLTLDLDLQQAALRALGDRVGAVVALDPRRGEVLVMVSSPSYDPNQFARGLDREQWQGLLDSPHHPLQNRAIQNVHSPGSIFKIVLGLAGWQEGLLDQERRVYCGGSEVFYGRRFRCWQRRGHGWVNLRAALKRSCDVYFYQLGRELGIERIGRYARAMGLGQATGIDLEGERAGLVPSREWSLSTRQQPWYPGETISVAIGQGPLLVSPLQMAVLMAGVANRGELPTPWLATPPVANPRIMPAFDPQAWAVVHEALWAVVMEQEGTGREARVEGFEQAGKTGTVQVISQSTWVRSEELPYEERDHAWFASWGPVEDPQLVVVVFIEHGGAGSRAAAPVAKAVYEELLAKQAALGPLADS